MTLISILKSKLVGYRRSKNLYFYGVLVGFGVLLPLPLFGSVLNMRGVAESVTANSVQLRQSSYLIDMQKADLQAAWAAKLPKVDTQYRLTYTDYDVSGRDALANIALGPDTVSVYPVKPSRYSAGLDTSLTQVLYSGGRIDALLALQTLKVTEAEKSREVLRQGLLADALGAFWAYVRAYQSEAYFDFLVSFLDVKRQRASQKKDQGLTAAISDLDVELGLLMHQSDSEMARRDRILKYSKLTALTQSQSEETVPHVALLDSRQYLVLWNQLADFDKDSDLLLDQKKLETLEKEQLQIIQDSRFYPEVYLRTGVNYFNVDDGDLKTAGWDLHYGSFYAAIHVDWNWFNGFKDVALSRKAALSQEWSRLEYDQVRQSKTVSLASLRHGVDAAISQLRRAEQTILRTYQLLADKRALATVHHVTDEELDDADVGLKKSELQIKELAIEVDLALLAWCKATYQMDRYIALRSPQ